MSRRPTHSALVVTVALLVVGCSSGGGKSATPTTTTKVTPTTITNASTTTLRNLPSVKPTAGEAWTLGQCPSQPPTQSLGALNAGVRGLRTTLISIAAKTVRVCRYSGTTEGLQGAGTLSTLAAVQLEGETNRLRTALGPVQGLQQDCGNGPFVFFVTFTGKQQVTVSDQAACGLITNGVLDAQPTAQWFNDVLHDTTSVTTPVGENTSTQAPITRRRALRGQQADQHP